MNMKPISPKVHGIADYVLVGSLLTLPTLLSLNKKAKNFYALEGLALLTYIAVTDHPTAIKPIIPFTTHGKIDPLNIAQVAFQSFWNRSGVIKKLCCSISRLPRWRVRSRY